MSKEKKILQKRESCICKKCPYCSKHCEGCPFPETDRKKCNENCISALK